MKLMGLKPVDVPLNQSIDNMDKIHDFHILLWFSQLFEPPFINI